MFKKISLVFLFVFALGLIGCSGEETDEVTSTKTDEVTSTETEDISYPKEYNIVDVISGEVTDDGVVMIIETDGYGGTMRAQVTVLDGEITEFNVEEHLESDGWGQVVIDDSGIIQALKDASDNLDNFDVNLYLDSEASASITAEALLDIARTAIEHYQDDYQ
ncbi:MAG TPA: FMN-binding protein [Candidatus Izemoplasmatales bacterium]|nr:FMN-binding protein [Candidatus Izemoplasmatales bacterium]